MEHGIDPTALGARASAVSDAVRACVHCGFCLPTCPTYAELGEEMDAPRGRIVLMKGVLEGEIEASAADTFIDRCLGCRACVSSCPSGVAYGDLLTSFRLHVEPKRSRGAAGALRRWLLALLARPRLLRPALRLGRAARPLASVLPALFAAALDALPRSVPRARPVPAGDHPARGTRRARVALLTGCAQRVLTPDVTGAAIRVLTHNGIEVTVPAGQGCCGALALHAGLEPDARRLAAHNLAAFPADVDAVIATAAGCGSGMRDYPLLFAGTDRLAAATRFADRVEDVSAFLDRVGLAAPPPEVAPMRVAYHDACHLAHAQGVRAAPRALLRAIPGLTLVEPAEPELCCGSAGIYNLEQPAIARRLGDRKAVNLLAADVDLIAAGNVGCAVWIGRRLEARGPRLPILHPIEILDRAYGRRRLV